MFIKTRLKSTLFCHMCKRNKSYLYMFNLKPFIMKSLKLIALAIVLSVSSISFAASVADNPTNDLQNEIVKLLGKTCEKLADETIEATVVFTVSEKGEVVVISVDSDNPQAELFVKCKLNYKQIKFDESTVEKIYHLPLKIVNI